MYRASNIFHQSCHVIQSTCIDANLTTSCVSTRRGHGSNVAMCFEKLSCIESEKCVDQLWNLIYCVLLPDACIAYYLIYFKSTALITRNADKDNNNRHRKSSKPHATCTIERTMCHVNIVKNNFKRIIAQHVLSNAWGFPLSTLNCLGVLANRLQHEFRTLPCSTEAQETINVRPTSSAGAPYQMYVYNGPFTIDIRNKNQPVEILN